MPTMHDDMNASVFTRTDRTLQLGKKAFNVSQPTLGMHISASATSGSEDHFDMTNTESSSPASSSQVHQTLPTHMPRPLAHDLKGSVSSVSVPEASNKLSAPSSLLSASEPQVRVLDGLPLSTEPRFILESATQSPSPAKPSLKQSQSTQSVTTTVSGSMDTVSFILATA
jgi:hypothetical protein